MHHSEWSIGTIALTSWLRYATLGWTIHSSILLSAFSLPGPSVHIGVVLFNEFVSAPLKVFIAVISDLVTRQKEFAADAYSAEVSERYAMALQNALAKLTASSSQDPDPPWFYE